MQQQIPITQEEKIVLQANKRTSEVGDYETIYVTAYFTGLGLVQV